MDEKNQIVSRRRWLPGHGGPASVTVRDEYLLTRNDATFHDTSSGPDSGGAMPEGDGCMGNFTPIWKRHHNANLLQHIVLSGEAKEAIRTASPSAPPGMALTEEAPPEDRYNLRPPPKEAPPSAPSNVDATKVIKTTSGSGAHIPKATEGGRLTAGPKTCSPASSRATSSRRP